MSQSGISHHLPHGAGQGARGQRTDQGDATGHPFRRHVDFVRNNRRQAQSDGFGLRNAARLPARGGYVGIGDFQQRPFRDAHLWTGKVDLLFAAKLFRELFQKPSSFRKIRADEQEPDIGIAKNPGKGPHQKIEALVPYIQPSEIREHERIRRNAKRVSRRRRDGLRFWQPDEIGLDEHWFVPERQDEFAAVLFPPRQKMQSARAANEGIKRIQVNEFFQPVNRAVKMQLAVGGEDIGKGLLLEPPGDFIGPRRKAVKVKYRARARRRHGACIHRFEVKFHDGQMLDGLPSFDRDLIIRRRNGPNIQTLLQLAFHKCHDGIARPA